MPHIDLTSSNSGVKIEYLVIDGRYAHILTLDQVASQRRRNQSHSTALHAATVRHEQRTSPLSKSPPLTWLSVWFGYTGYVRWTLPPYIQAPALY